MGRDAGAGGSGAGPLGSLEAGAVCAAAAAAASGVAAVCECTPLSPVRTLLLLPEAEAQARAEVRVPGCAKGPSRSLRLAAGGR